MREGASWTIILENWKGEEVAGKQSGMGGAKEGSDGGTGWKKESRERGRPHQPYSC